MPMNFWNNAGEEELDERHLRKDQAEMKELYDKQQQAGISDRVFGEFVDLTFRMPDDAKCKVAIDLIYKLKRFAHIVNPI